MKLHLRKIELQFFTIIWAENSQAFIQTSHRFKCLDGIIGDYLIGPVILPNRLLDATYLNFLMNTLL